MKPEIVPQHHGHSRRDISLEEKRRLYRLDKLNEIQYYMDLGLSREQARKLYETKYLLRQEQLHQQHRQAIIREALKHAIMREKSASTKRKSMKRIKSIKRKNKKLKS